MRLKRHFRTYRKIILCILITLGTYFTLIVSYQLCQREFSSVITRVIRDKNRSLRSQFDLNINAKPAIFSSGDSLTIRKQNTLKYGKVFDKQILKIGSENANISKGFNKCPKEKWKTPLKIIFSNEKSFELWPKDRNCNKFKVNFVARHSLPKCGLVSFPGSGNTWLRRLIESSTGVFTGSLYKDTELYLKGFYGELKSYIDGTTLVQKCHESSSEVVRSFHGKAILLIRNPYRAILAYFNFRFGGHKLYSQVVQLRSEAWRRFLRSQTKRWLDTVIKWTENGEKLLVIHYENLLDKPLKEIRKIMMFLNIFPNEERLKCILNHKSDEMKRKTEYLPKTIEIFPSEARDRLDRSIRYTAYLLKKHGCESLPLDKYEFFNGSPSRQISFVPCFNNESTIDCDQRIDEINNKNGFNNI